MDKFAMIHFTRVILNERNINGRIITQLARFCKLHFWVSVLSITATVEAAGCVHI